MQGVVVLAGGKSRRMGQDKAFLPLEKGDFLSTVCGHFQQWEERLLSVGTRIPPDCHGFTPIPDLVLDRGPLGGIYTGLTACRSSPLLVVGCDMPFFSEELGRYLIHACQEKGDQACVLTGREGKLRPLGAVYAKTALPAFMRQIHSQDFCLLTVLRQLSVRVIALEETGFEERELININTREEYERLCGVRRI